VPVLWKIWHSGARFSKSLSEKLPDRFLCLGGSTEVANSAEESVRRTFPNVELWIHSGGGNSFHITASTTLIEGAADNPPGVFVIRLTNFST
jgi:hypothetical protein